MSAIRRLGLVCLALLALTDAAFARDKIIGVSWANLTAAHWQMDEAALRRAVELAGDKMISLDAQGSSDRQADTVTQLIAAGANALIVHAVDPGALAAALASARSEKIPVIAYETPIEAADVLWIGFDAAAAGQIQLQTLARLAPQGNYARLTRKDNAEDVRMAAAADATAPGLAAISITASSQIDAPGSAEAAAAALDLVLATPDQKIAAVLTSDDRLAEGAITSLTARGLSGIPVAGAGAAPEALNRIAAGSQALTLWNDPRLSGRAAGRAASALAAGNAIVSLEGAAPAETYAGTAVSAILLKPSAVTRDSLASLLAAGWIVRDDLCRNVDAAVFALCQE